MGNTELFPLEMYPFTLKYAEYSVYPYLQLRYHKDLFGKTNNIKLPSYGFISKTNDNSKGILMNTVFIWL